MTSSYILTPLDKVEPTLRWLLLISYCKCVTKSVDPSLLKTFLNKLGLVDIFVLTWGRVLEIFNDWRYFIIRFLMYFRIRFLINFLILFLALTIIDVVGLFLILLFLFLFSLACINRSNSIGIKLIQFFPKQQWLSNKCNVRGSTVKAKMVELFILFLFGSIFHIGIVLKADLFSYYFLSLTLDISVHCISFISQINSCGLVKLRFWIE